MKKIIVNYTTGNRYEDGTPEVGRTEEYDFETCNIDDILNSIPPLTSFFLSDENGERLDYMIPCGGMF